MRAMYLCTCVCTYIHCMNGITRVVGMDIYRVMNSTLFQYANIIICVYKQMCIHRFGELLCGRFIRLHLCIHQSDEYRLVKN